MLLRRRIPFYKRRSLSAYFLLTVALICLSRPIFACSCLRISEPCERVGAHAIFVGTVTHIFRTTHGVGNNEWPGYSMEFDVEVSLKGNVGKTARVETGQGGGDCGTPLEQGKRYLVFAHQSKEQLWIGLCNRSEELTGGPADSELIDQVRKLVTPGRGSLFGTVTSDAGANRQPLGIGGITVRAVSTDRTVTTRTADDGKYTLQNLPNARYTVSLELPKGWKLEHYQPPDVERTVSDGSCLRSDFRVQPDTNAK